MRPSFLISLVLLMGAAAGVAHAQPEVAAAVRLYEGAHYRQAQIGLERWLAAHPDDARARYYLGRVDFALDRYDRALDALEQAVRLKPDAAEYHFWLGRVCGEKAMHVNVVQRAWLALKVKREFAKAVDLDPRNVDARVGLANYYLQAPGLMGGDLDKARAQAEALVRLDEVEGRLLLAKIDMAQHRPGAAEARYARLLQRYGRTSRAPDICGDYGVFLLSQKRFGAAIRMFERQVRLGPAAAPAHAHLADAYRGAGRLNDAVREYRRALALDPTLAEVRNKLRDTETELQTSLAGR